MPPILLNVSHLRQRTRADCLPICSQMVTDYLGLSIPYTQLVKLLQTEWFGTPFRHILRLEQIGLSVAIDHLALDDIVGYLEKEVPVIVCVHTADLSYWSQSVDHVVVVVGIDDKHVFINDPSLPNGSLPIPITEFELAQLAYDNLCAVIQVSH